MFSFMHLAFVSNSPTNFCFVHLFCVLYLPMKVILKLSRSESLTNIYMNISENLGLNYQEKEGLNYQE